MKISEAINKKLLAQIPDFEEFKSSGGLEGFFAKKDREREAAQKEEADAPRKEIHSKSSAELQKWSEEKLFLDIMGEHWWLEEQCEKDRKNACKKLERYNDYFKRLKTRSRLDGYVLENQFEKERAEFGLNDFGQIVQGSSLDFVLSSPNVTAAVLKQIASAGVNLNTAQRLYNHEKADNGVKKKLKNSSNEEVAAWAKREYHHVGESLQLHESIDRNLLDKIPPFEQWRKGGGSTRGYYKNKVKEKYNTRVTDAHGRDHMETEDYKWALEQEKEGSDNLWGDEQAQRLSKIMPDQEFIYNSHSYQDHYGRHLQSYSYYQSGRHNSYRDQGYQ